MTANLLHEHCDVAEFANLLDDVAPDVVVTQELAQDAAALLTERFATHRLRPSTDFTGRGIATSLPAELGDIPMKGRYGTSALLKVAGAPVRLAGIHLLNPINFPWWRAVRSRSSQVRSLLDWVGEDRSPTVVAGDFNASPAWPAYRQVAGRLDDLVAEHARREGHKPQRTWGWRPGWPRMLRIDHVFGQDVAARSVDVRRIEGSDHHAVVVDISIVDPGGK